MKWPAKLAKAIRFDKPVGHVDIFATAAAAAVPAANVPTDRALDGVDLMPFATGASDRQPHKTLFWRDGDYRVLLAGNWKLQTSERPKKAWLNNLADDPNEKANLAEQMPDKVAELSAIMAAVDAEQSKPLWPSLLETPIRIDQPLGTPAKADAEYIYWAN